jgi:anti-sigma factor RsiW
MAHDKSSCRRMLGSLSDYVNEDLNTELCTEIERHLAECGDCQVVVDTLRKTVSLVHANASTPVVPEDVRKRLYKLLDLDEFIQARKES